MVEGQGRAKEGGLNRRQGNVAVVNVAVDGSGAWQYTDGDLTGSIGGK
jgi:hypothetical protein